MPFCTVCTHTLLDKIEADLASERSLHEMRRRYGLSRESLRRHRVNKHREKREAKAEGRIAEARSAGPIARLEQRIAEVKRLQRKAEEAGEITAAVTASKEIDRLEQRLDELSRQCDPSLADFNVTVSFSDDDREPTVTEDPPAEAPRELPPTKESPVEPWKPSDPPQESPRQPREFFDVDAAEAASERREKDPWRPF
jgi:hypothetical protein